MPVVFACSTHPSLIASLFFDPTHHQRGRYLLDHYLAGSSAEVVLRDVKAPFLIGSEACSGTGPGGFRKQPGNLANSPTLSWNNRYPKLDDGDRP